MEEFLINILDLVILMSFGVVYLFAFARIKSSFLLRFGSSRNDALNILFLGGLVAAVVNLVHTSSAASDAVLFFLSANEVLKALLYAFCFFVGAWAISLVMFLMSFLIVSKLTNEDEREELIKNNTTLAWLHVIILVSLTFVVAPALVKIAVYFIPYPSMPF
jgi:hypothetical protein